MRVVFPKFFAMALVSSATLTLSACGGNPEQSADKSANKTADATTNPTGPDVMPAGKYLVTVNVTKMDIPDLTPDEVEGIKAEIAKPSQQETCLTADDLKPEGDLNTMTAVISAIMGDMQGEGCNFTEFSTAGGRIAGKLSCANSSYGNLTSGIVSGKITANETSFTVDGSLSVKDVSEKPIAFANTTTMTRKGDCTG
jgi:hypothetical protein